MNEAVVPNPNARLSDELRRHASSGQPFLGFISYRRRDALAPARWLRDRITTFVPPAELRQKIEDLDHTVGGRQNRVFLDLSYQKPNVDFWDEHIGPSLCRSRSLLLLLTPSVFETLDDGQPNWVEREIETFLAFHSDPSRILVVLGPGAEMDRFPPSLARISSRWDWIDLRFFSESSLARLRHADLYDAQIAKVLAKIYDIADGDLPILNQEFGRGRARVRRSIAAAGVAALLGMSALTSWALVERSRAANAEKLAVAQRDEALRQRNAALMSQSRYLASMADDLVKEGTVRGAVGLLRVALPDRAAGNERPLVREAVASAYNAVYANRERGPVELLPGATAADVGPRADRIVAADAGTIVIRDGMRGGADRRLAHDFGAPARLVLAPGGDRLLMIDRSGAVSVRDLPAGREVLRHAGVGTGSRGYFLAGGGRLLVTSPDGTELRLFDVATGAVLAQRRLDAGDGVAVKLVTEPRTGLIAAIVGNRLLRLSTENLSDQAELGLGGIEFAMTVSADGGSIYVATSTDLLDGSVLEVDSATLAVQRRFGKVTGGARHVAVAPNGKRLAIHGIIGVDFFDVPKGERLFHVVVSREAVHGQFVGGLGSDYVAFGSNGFVRRYSPELGIELAAYRVVDGGSIEKVVELPDKSGFLTLSDRSAITSWTFDSRNLSRELSVPLTVGGRDWGLPIPFDSFGPSLDRRDIVAAYSDRSIRRWNLETGAMREVAGPDPHGERIKHVIGLDDGVNIAATESGRLIVHRTAAEGPVARIGGEPWEHVGAVAARQVVLVSARHAVWLLDVADPAHPRLTEVAAAGSCVRYDTGADVILCLDAAGGIRLLRPTDGTTIAEWPRDELAPLASAAFSRKRDGVAFSRTDGSVTAYALADRRLTGRAKLAMNLSGAALKRAAGSSLLRDADREKIASGATELDVPVGANRLQLSPDGRHVAAALPDRTVKLIDLVTGETRTIGRGRRGPLRELAFSHNGALIAMIEQGDYVALYVHEVVSGQRIASISLSSQPNARLFPVPDGRALATVDDSGRILLHPVFEDPADLISYLAREFPGKLTPAQRRAYFIE